MSGVHLGPEDGMGWLTPDDELEEYELGERVSYWLTLEAFALLYSAGPDRVHSMTLYLLGSAAMAGKAQ